MALAVQSNTDIIITYDVNNTIIIENYDLADLNANDFIF